MNSEKVVRSYYSRIRTLPDLKYIVAGTIVEGTALIARGISLGLEFILAPFVYLTVGLVGYRRLRKFSLFIFNLTVLFYLLFSFTPVQPVYAFGVFLPLAGYVLIGYMREEITYAVLTIQSILPSLVFGILPLYYVYIIAVILTFSLYIYVINHKGKSVIGIRSLEVFRPFLTSFMNKEYRLVDDFMNVVSTKHNVIVPIFRLGDEIFVVPKLHYGLFGKAGSSEFIYDLESKCPNCTTFHGPGSHELDAATASESRRIADAVAEFVKTGEWKPLKFYGVQQWVEGDILGHTLVFDRVTLTFLQRPGKGIDDLPQELWNYSYGTGNFLIDTHSEILKEEITAKDVNAIKKALGSLERKSERPLLLSKKEGSLKERCEGLCNQKVKVFAISDGEKKVGIVYVYANNSDEELSRELQNVPGYDSVILVTPDDHSCTGVAIGELYSPAVKCESLIEKARELLKEALNDMKPVQAYFGMVTVEGVKLIGPVISSLLQSLNVVGDFVRKTYWIPLLLPFLAIGIIVLFQTLLSAH